MVTQQGQHGFDTGIYSDWLTRVSTGPGTEADFYDCLVVVSVAGHRAFSAAGPTAWNSLPVAFRDPTISDACFRRHLKTVLFAQQRWHHSV